MRGWDRGSRVSRSAGVWIPAASSLPLFPTSRCITTPHRRGTSHSGCGFCTGCACVERVGHSHLESPHLALLDRGFPLPPVLFPGLHGRGCGVVGCCRGVPGCSSAAPVVPAAGPWISGDLLPRAHPVPSSGCGAEIVSTLVLVWIHLPGWPVPRFASASIGCPLQGAY
jgi:hypothetical protein